MRGLALAVVFLPALPVLGATSHSEEDTETTPPEEAALSSDDRDHYVRGVLDMAQELYQEGRADEVLAVLAQLGEDENLTLVEELRVRRLRALAYYRSGQSETAKEQAYSYLSLHPSPTWSEDDLEDQTERFFRELGDAEQDPRSDPALQKPRQPSTEKRTWVSQPTPHARPCEVALCMVPLGVGQFVNGRIAKGILFAGLEVGALTGTWIVHQQRNSTYDRDPINFDEAQDRRRANVQNVFLGVFVVSAIAGVVDAFVFP